MIRGMKNSKKQGDVGMGIAIGWLTSRGYTVSIPITDSQEYDLIFDDGSLNKVQVKTTISEGKYGTYIVTLKTCGGNRSGRGKIKKFDNSKVDYVFILTKDGDMYFIPSKEIDCGNQISLGSKYSRFKIDWVDG